MGNARWGILGVVVLLAAPGAAAAAPPQVTEVTALSANPTNQSQVDFRVVFDQPVTGVDASDFDVPVHLLEGAGVLSVSGIDATYTVAVSTGSGNGLLGLDVLDDDTIVNGGAEPLAAGHDEGDIYFVDRSAPSASVRLADTQSPRPTSQPLRFRATFDEPVEGFDVDDLVVTGPPGDITGEVHAVDDETYDVTIGGFTQGGEVTVAIAEGAAQDAAGNGSRPAQESRLTLPGPEPVLSTGVVDFGALPVRSPTVHRTVRVTNGGAFPLTITSAGTSARVLSATRGTCTSTIQPGDGCELHVAFTPPRTPGAHTATVRVRTNGGTVQIGLTGSAVAQPPAPPPVVDTVAPGLALRTTSLRMSRTREVRVPLVCGEVGRCALSMRLHAGTTTLATRKATVLGLRDLKITLRLSKAAARRIQRAGRRGARMTLRVTATDARGNRKVHRFAVRVRRV